MQPGLRPRYTYADYCMVEAMNPSDAWLAPARPQPRLPPDGGTHPLGSRPREAVAGDHLELAAAPTNDQTALMRLMRLAAL